MKLGKVNELKRVTNIITIAVVILGLLYGSGFFGGGNRDEFQFLGENLTLMIKGLAIAIGGILLRSIVLYIFKDKGDVGKKIQP